MEKTKEIKEIEICPNCGYKFKDEIAIVGIKDIRSNLRFSIVEKPEFRDDDIFMCVNCGTVCQVKKGILELVDVQNRLKEEQDICNGLNIIRELGSRHR